MSDSPWRDDEGKPAADSDSKPRRRRSVRKRKKKSRATRLYRIGIPVALSVVLLLAIDGLYVVLRLQSQLQKTKEELILGRDAFGDARFSDARTNLEAARDAADGASGLTRHPSFFLGSHLPWINDDVRAADALITTADLTSRAGVEALNAASAMKADDSGVAGSLFSQGSIDFDALAEGAPFITRAAELMASAAEAVREAPEPRTGILSDALREVEVEVERAAETAHKGMTMFESLPEIMGVDGPRTYLLAFQALGESRGTGGLVGLYGVLEADDGEIDLLHVGPTKSVLPEEADDPAEAPSWFIDNYGPQSSLVEFRQANLTPNFSVAARVLLGLYEQETNEDLDGVIAMDPVAIGNMAEGTGPLAVPGIDDAVGPDNAAEILLQRSYVAFSSDAAQSRYLSRLVEKFWERVSSGDLNEQAFAEGLAEAAVTNHLKVFSSNSDIQRDMNELEIAGTFAQYGPSLQLVFQNNYGLNKVDYFLKRSIDTTVDLSREGFAEISTTVTLENDAPEVGSTILLGQKNKGTNRMQLAFLLPKDAEVRTMKTNGKDGPANEYSDTGFPVAWKLLDIPPGEKATVSIDYEAPANYLDNTYRLTLVPQTMTRPDLYSLKVLPPEGFDIRDAQGTGDFSDNFEVSGNLPSTRTFEFDLVPTN